MAKHEGLSAKDRMAGTVGGGPSAEEGFWGWELDDFVLREQPERGDRVFDLDERTARFGEAVVRFARKITQDAVSTPLIQQLVRAGTSVGANYCEADDAVSPKEFRNKIGTCRKEARETKFWLRTIATAQEPLKDQARVLWQEARELHLIFSAIWRKGARSP